MRLADGGASIQSHMDRVRVHAFNPCAILPIIFEIFKKNDDIYLLLWFQASFTWFCIEWFINFSR